MRFQRRPSCRLLAAGAALAGLLGPHDAGAVPVTPGGGFAALPGTSAAAEPALAGDILVDTLSHWVSADDPLYGFPGAEGELQSRVVREAATGTLDFYWRVIVYGPSYPSFVPTSLTISGLPLDSFLTGGSFDADYRTDGSGTAAPVEASATMTSVTWEFDSDTLGPGTSTYFFFLRSNVTTWYSGAIAELGVSSLLTYSPTLVPPPVPEPAGGVLALAGLAVAGVLRRRTARA